MVRSDVNAFLLSLAQGVRFFLANDLGAVTAVARPVA